MSEEPNPPATSEVIDVDKLQEVTVFRGVTEATVKYESPPTRQAREAKEAVLAAHERLVTLVKLIFSGVLMLGYFILGVYLLSPKSGTTEEQKRFAKNVLVALAGAATGYVFGKKEGKSDKE